MADLTINLDYFTVGDTFEVTVSNVKNNGPSVATGVKVTVTIPTGLAYVSSSLDKGSYNTVTNVWTIGSLNKGESVDGTFTFQVTDDCEKPYTINFDVTTVTGCDSCLDNNNYCVVANGVSCCDIRGCTGISATPSPSPTVTPTPRS